MTLFRRLLQRLPIVQQLEAERNALRAEQSSIHLKLRASAAKMAVLEEERRVAQRDRDRLAERLARQAAEHRADTARLEAMLAEARALATDRSRATDGKPAAAEPRRAAHAPSGTRQPEGTAAAP